MINKCYIDATGNNLFIQVIKNNNELLMQSSTGQVKMKGPYKRTSYAAELVGRQIGEKLSILNQKNLNIYIKGKVSKSVRSALLGLELTGASINSISLLNIVAHNGVRLSRNKRK